MTLQKRIWVDSDIAIGHQSGFLGFCDVDDGYALAVLLRSVEVSIAGVSSTLGNTDDIAVTTDTARSFISTYGPNSISVYQGADAKLPEDLSTVTSNAAVEQLAATLREERLTILALGAATNIATLLLKYPELEDRIDEIVLVAGRRSMDQHFISGHWQVTPFRDLNFESDVRAFQILLDSDVQLTLVPFEACHQVWIKHEDLERLGETSKIGRFLADRSRGWMAEWAVVFGANGFNPFDMVAAGYIIQPQLFKWHQWKATIEEGPDDTDSDQIKPYLICSPDIKKGRSVNYCVYVDEICRKLMLERICNHDMSAFVLGLSHVNVVVPSVDEATEFYGRVLGFQQAYDSDGQKMDYTGVEMKPFALDAGILDAKVNVDVRFLRHPQANIYLELMAYHVPKGNQAIPPQPKTYDMGGARHIAMEVSNCKEVFDYLRRQEGVTMINRSEDYYPVKLDGFPITFFYWIDKYGIQWEMEEGRQVGTSRGIA